VLSGVDRYHHYLLLEYNLLVEDQEPHSIAHLEENNIQRAQSRNPCKNDSVSSIHNKKLVWNAVHDILRDINSDIFTANHGHLSCHHLD
jgi:hypothetical protein